MSEFAITLVAGSIGVAGVVIGGLMQRRWQVQDQQNARREARSAEVRARMDVKADEILLLLRDLENVLFDRNVVRFDLWPDDPDERRRARRLLDEIMHASGYLTGPLRQHVRVVGHLVPDAEQLSQGWLDAAPRTMAWVSIRSARQQVERYLRDETVAPDLAEPVGTYEQAWQDLQNYIEHQIEQQMDEAERLGRDASRGGRPVEE